MAVMGCGVEPRAPVLSPLPIPPPTHFTNVTDVKIFSEVIWTKSKRAATFFRETFPKLPNWKNWLIFVCFWSSQAIWVPVALKFLTQILVDWVEVSWDKAAWSDWGIRWCKAAQTRKSGRLVWYEDHSGLSKHLLYRCTICLKVSFSAVSLTGCRALSFPCLL